MDQSLELSSVPFGDGVVGILKPLVRESDWLGHSSGVSRHISRWSQSDQSCDVFQFLRLIELGVESAILVGKNVAPVQPPSARRRSGVKVIDSGEDKKRASNRSCAHRERHLKDIIKPLVFHEDDETESEGSLWGSEESDHENRPKSITACQVSGDGISTLATMSPLSASAVTTRTRGSDEGGKEKDDFQAEERRHDAHQKDNVPQDSRAGKRSSHNDDQDNEESESADDIAKKKPKNTSMGETRPRLACPFYKSDPAKYSVRNNQGKIDKYRVCGGPGFTSIHRLKEHLKRVHRPHPYQCPRCFSTFNGSKELVDHTRRLSVCELRNRPPPEGIDEEKWQMISERGKKTRTELGKWNDIWAILFPETPTPEHCWHTLDDNRITPLSSIDVDRLVALFDERIESDISQGIISLEGSQGGLKERYIQALRHTLATANGLEGRSMALFSEEAPPANDSDPLSSEPAGSLKTLSGDPAALSRSPKERPTVASETLQPLQPDKPLNDWDYSISLTYPLELLPSDIILSTMKSSEEGAQLQQSILAAHDTTTEGQPEGSGAIGIPKDALEGNLAQGNISRPSGGNGRVVCKKCPRSFSRLSDLQRHDNFVHSSVRLNCPVPNCANNGGRGFSRADKLRAHRRNQHGW